MQEFARRLRAAGAVAAIAAAAGPVAAAQADVKGWTFEPPLFSVGDIHDQAGWSKTGPFDSVVSANPGAHPFGAQSLRISNAVTSGSFGDQTFAPSLVDAAGETTSVDRGGASGGVRQTTFEASFRVMSTQATEQPGLFLSLSPDNGLGDRMSYVGLSDSAGGIDVIFYDTPDPAACDGVGSCFALQEAATDLDRTVPHHIRVKTTFNDGPDNDVVQVFVDGVLAATGETWENYYRNHPEQAGNGNVVAATDTLLFRASGPAAAGTAGEGFRFDDVRLESYGGPGGPAGPQGPSGPAGPAGAPGVTAQVPVPVPVPTVAGASDRAHPVKLEKFTVLDADRKDPTRLRIHVTCPEGAGLCSGRAVFRIGENTVGRRDLDLDEGESGKLTVRLGPINRRRLEREDGNFRVIALTRNRVGVASRVTDSRSAQAARRRAGEKARKARDAEKKAASEKQ